MAQFKINELSEVHNYVQARERLWLTADDKIVADGDPKAERLFATPSDRISVEDAEKYGLIKGKAKAKG